MTPRTGAPTPMSVSAWRAHTRALRQAQAQAAAAERAFVAAWRERQRTRRALRVIERTHP